MTKARRDPRPSLHVIDLDNLLNHVSGSAQERFDALIRTWGLATRFRPGDVGVMAGRAELLGGVEELPPQIELLPCGDETQAADRALVGATQRIVVDEADAARFRRVVLGTRDGDFVEELRRLRELGLRVEVAAWRTKCSRELRRLSSAMIWLDGFFAPAGPRDWLG